MSARDRVDGGGRRRRRRRRARARGPRGTPSGSARGRLIMAMRHVSRRATWACSSTRRASARRSGARGTPTFPESPTRVSSLAAARGRVAEKTPRPALVPAGAIRAPWRRRRLLLRGGASRKTQGDDAARRGAVHRRAPPRKRALPPERAPKTRRRRRRKNASFTSPSLDAASRRADEASAHGRRSTASRARVPGGAEEVFWHVFGGGCGAAEGVFRSGDCCSEESAFSCNDRARDGVLARQRRRRRFAAPRREKTTTMTRGKGRGGFVHGRQGGGLRRRAVFRLHRGAEEEGASTRRRVLRPAFDRPSRTRRTRRTEGSARRRRRRRRVVARGRAPACAGGRLTVTDAAGHAVSSGARASCSSVQLEARLANRRARASSGWRRGAEAAKRRARGGRGGEYILVAQRGPESGKKRRRLLLFFRRGCASV